MSSSGEPVRRSALAAEAKGGPAGSKPPAADEGDAPAAMAALQSGLYVTATPIGNAGDLTLRARDVLTRAAVVVAEDTRVTAKLFALHGIGTKLVSYRAENAARATPAILARLARGEAVALVTDAGTPHVSDPGAELVAAAAAAGHKVFAVPGASALLAALVAAGLPTDCFLFDGFLPPKAGQRANRIAALASVPATLVFYETGPRLAESLADLAARLGGRRAAVCRELTKAFEEVRRGDLPALAAHYAGIEPPRGEIVLVVGPPLEEAAGDDAVDEALRRALAERSLKDAVAAVAAVTGRPKREVYARALALTERTPPGDD